MRSLPTGLSCFICEVSSKNKKASEEFYGIHKTNNSKRSSTPIHQSNFKVVSSWEIFRGGKRVSITFFSSLVESAIMFYKHLHRIQETSLHNEHRRATAAVSPLWSYGNYPSQISRAVQNTTPECECPLSLSSRESGSSSRLTVVGPAQCYENQWTQLRQREQEGFGRWYFPGKITKVGRSGDIVVGG